MVEGEYLRLNGFTSSLISQNILGTIFVYDVRYSVEIKFRDGRFRYEEVPEEHHDHLIDVRNGKVVEFQNDEIEKIQKRVAQELGYELVDHRLELYGIPIKEKK